MFNCISSSSWFKYYQKGPGSSSHFSSWDCLSSALNLTYLFLILYWSIVNLQCCVSFMCTAKWVHYAYLFFFRLFSHIDYYRVHGPLCYTVGHCWLSILHIVVCAFFFLIYWSIVDLQCWCLPGYCHSVYSPSCSLPPPLTIPSQSHAWYNMLFCSHFLLLWKHDVCFLGVFFLSSLFYR